MLATQKTSDLSADNVDHFILTPFYVRRQLRSNGATEIASLTWLDTRLELFQQYCLPSILMQSCKRFRWLIFLDSQTPRDYIDRMQSLLGADPQFVIVFCSSWEERYLVQAVKQHSRPEAKWVLTTRMDNDDGLARDFVERAQAATKPCERKFINFSRGVLLYRNKMFLYKHTSNAFLSYLEPIESFSTVFCTAHELASEIAPIVQVAGTVAFLQVVHGGNVSNKPRGRRIERASVLKHFAPDMISNAPGSGAESRIEIAIYNLFFGSFWGARDYFVRIFKALRRQFSSLS